MIPNVSDQLAKPEIDRRDREGYFFGTTNPHWHDTVRRLFAHVEEAGVNYCILHGYGGYDGVESGDIDCIVEPANLPYRFGRALSDAAAREGCHLINWYYRAQKAHVFVLARETEDGFECFWLDVQFANYEGPWQYYSAAEMLAVKRRVNGFWATSPGIEFACYLATKITKHRLEPAHGARLAGLYAQDPAGCEAELARFFRPGTIERLVNAARQNDWTFVRDHYIALEAELLAIGRARGLRAPRTTAGYLSGEAWRRSRRLTRRTGLHLLLTGEPGATAEVAEAAARLLAPAFRQVEVQAPAGVSSSLPATMRSALKTRLALSRTALVISLASSATRPDLTLPVETTAPSGNSTDALDSRVRRVATAVISLLEQRTKRALGTA